MCASFRACHHHPRFALHSHPEELEHPCQQTLIHPYEAYSYADAHASSQLAAANPQFVPHPILAVTPAICVQNTWQ